MSAQHSYIFVPPLSGAGLTLDQVRTCVIGDVRARYRRARGDTVLYACALDDTGPAREQLERLGLSLSWSQVACFAEPATRAWAQWLFLRLRARRLVEERQPGGAWTLRLAPYLEENYRGLAELDAWSDRARGWQEAIIAPVKGVELQAQGIDGTALPVFTVHAERLTGATLVALSPGHPEIDKWVRSPQTRERVAGMLPGDGQVIATGLFAWVPTIEQMLPVAIASAVHDRIGASALLVIPKADADDAAIAAVFDGPTTTSYNYRGKRSKPRPAARFVTPDLTISASDDHGVAVPLLHCEDCGVVAAPLDTLPVEGGGEARCPDCGGTAVPDGRVLDHLLMDALSWMVPAAPAGDPSALGDDADADAALARWLADSTLIAPAAAGDAVHGMRTIGKALRDLGAVADGEPFRQAFIHEPVQLGERGAVPIDAPDLDALLADDGADALRLAVLHAAAASKPLTWNGETLAHTSRLLERLRAFAAPRLAGHGDLDWAAPRPRDTADLRRLDRWVDVATIKITANLEALDLHRATRNVQMLLDRIEDFAAHAGATDDPSGDAVAAALLVLTKLASPLAPRLADELWAAAGQPGTVHDAPWPRQRAAVAA